MKRLLLVLGLVVLIISVYAQESGPVAPEQTDIFVPELILQVEELAIEQVEALLPRDTDPPIGQIILPLPGSDELFITDVSLDVPLPGRGFPSTGHSSVFSTGRLGAGTSSHVVGELSLYKLGDDPQFRVRFAHESVDGFQFEPAGTGYFLRSNVLDARVSAGEDPVAFTVVGSFSETENGLQGNSDYFSVNLRETTADVEFRYRPDPLITIAGELTASSNTRLQSTSGAGTAPRDQEFVVNPRVSASTSVSIVELSLSSGYFLRFLTGGALPTVQDIAAAATISIDPSDTVSISGAAGVIWDFADRLLYPWHVSLEATLAGALDISLSGGFRYERTSLGTLWQETPLLAVGDQDGSELFGDAQWFAEADAIFSGLGGVTVRSSVEYVMRDAAVDIQPYDTAADQFPFVQRAVQTLYPRVSFVWRPTTAVLVEGGWNGAFIDTVTGEPTGSIHAAIRFDGDEGPFSASMEVESELYPVPTLPNLGFSGSFSASDGVDFVLEVVDVLSPLLTDGRGSVGSAVSPAFPFIEPGFRVSVFTRISL